MNYKIINSGSDGNCVIVNDIIAIDMGVSYKKLTPYLSKLKIVLLTHQHVDHFKQSTIRKLAQNKPGLRFGCCEWLVQKLIDSGVSKKNVDVYETNVIYDYTVFSIKPVELYHDVPNCGYRVFFEGKKLIYMTDTKTLDGISAKGYDVYLVEGNYENEEELHNRAYTYDYELRVKQTHLSKEYTTQWLLENMSDDSIYEFMHQHKVR